MSFENLDASAFYVTSIGEKQSPARQFFTECRAQKSFLGWRIPTEGGTEISATGVGEMWLRLGVLGLRSLPINRVDLDSGITNPTSLRTSFAREFQTKPKQVLSQKYLHTHGPTGTIAGGAHNRTFFRYAFVLFLKL